CFPLTGLDYW
nr:immunoglobulin heavy chain junction region [Mus musculus]MBK4188635.1 immunoglobulin heavy chain junction region [Mus musculus]MBK4188636.1 immunoglobulin heavy chain junction region [Mus musculus]MBK4188637.1 immunoglobulin heavy chain junction region [Mus musculus]MBK4188639.1 immunoglobulin heavy chain junction region [Mus musculus]